MALTLLAIEPIEGKAFYEEEGKIYFLRPLYGEGGIIRCSEEQMKLVIKREGYYELKKKLSNIKEVITFVRNEYENIRGDKGLKVPNDEQLKQIVHEASDSLLMEYIKKAIEIWIPKGQLDRAKLLFDDVIEIPNIRSRVDLYDYIKKLYAKIKDVETPKEVIISQSSKDGFYATEDLDVIFVSNCRQRFPSLAGAYSRNIFKKVILNIRDGRLQRSCNMILCEL